MIKNKNFVLITLFIISSCILAPTVKCQELNDSTILDVPLEQLLNIDVTVASKKSETVADAPASITAYTNKDIEKLGYYTLGDLANITAGYSAFKGIGETTFETRGQMQSGFDNNKHLVLVDGIPFNHARANMAPAEENLPLFFAQRVEFLKGPGSALYGTSAFSGVINIVSKDLEKNGTVVESRFSLGNLDFKRRAMMNVIHRTDEGISKISASYFGKDATRDYLGNGVNPNANSIYYDNSTSLFLNASHKLTTTALKGLAAGLIYSRKTGGLGEFWMFQQNQTYPINEITWEQVVPYVRYERQFTEKLHFNSYIKGNMSTEKAYAGGYQQTINPAYGNLVMSNYNIRVFDKELFGELKYELSEKTNFIAGINGISRNSTGSPESYAIYLFAGPGVTFQPDTLYYPRSSSYNMYSGFVQVQHEIDFLKGLTITAGTRLDEGRVYSAKNGGVTNSFNHISPRIALVQRLTNAFNLKLMYGNAFRAPLIKEVGLNEEARATALSSPGTASYINLIPNVKPETISSLEAALIYTHNKITLSGTCFYNETKNALGAITVDQLNNARIFSNLAGTIKSKGFETEAQLIPTKHLMIKANYSYAKAIDQQGNQLGNVPTSKLNGYLTYTFTSPVELSITLVGRWLVNYRAGVVHPFISTSGFAQDNSLMPGYKVFDMNIIGKITNNMNLELQVRNILNSKIITPTGIINSGMLNVPYPGRSFLATVAFKF